MRQDNWLPRPEAALWLAADRIPGRFSQSYTKRCIAAHPRRSLVYPPPGQTTATGGTRASTSASSGPR